MPWWGWVLVGMAWCLLSVPAAVLVGRSIRVGRR